MTLRRAVRAVVVAVLRAYFRLEVTGGERVPVTGGFVLAPVHRSFLDFALVAATTRRPMHYMAKDSLWKVAWFGRLLEVLGAFPVRRGSVDRSAMRHCMDAAGSGEGVVMFPEGTRRSGPVVERLFDGAAYVACRQQVPIVPVGIGGSEAAMPKGRRLPRRARIRLVVGEPLPCPAAGRGRASRSAVQDLTVRLRAELQSVFDEASGVAG